MQILKLMCFIRNYVCLRKVLYIYVLKVVYYYDNQYICDLYNFDEFVNFLKYLYIFYNCYMYGFNKQYVFYINF